MKKKAYKVTGWKRFGLCCLLILANIIIVDVIRSLVTVERGTPFGEAVAASKVFNLWTYGKTSIIEKSGGIANREISGILYSDDEPSAVIDGRVVKEGDVVWGAEVLKIERDRVLFKRNHRTWSQQVNERPASLWLEED